MTKKPSMLLWSQIEEPTSFYFFLSASHNLLQSKPRDLFCSIFHLTDISMTICIFSCNQNTFYTLLKIWQHTQETFVVHPHMPQHAGGGQLTHLIISVTSEENKNVWQTWPEMYLKKERKSEQGSPSWTWFGGEKGIYGGNNGIWFWMWNALVEFSILHFLLIDTGVHPNVYCWCVFIW